MDKTIWQVKQCAHFIKEAKRIGALTGAGISTKAGIPDFRGPQGLCVTHRYDADKIFDIDYFNRNAEPFFDFARDFVRLEKAIAPTYAHQFLRRLEEEGKLKGIVTQNIDALHQRAGSQTVYEIHGSIWQSHCLSCGKAFSYSEMCDKVFAEKVPHCFCHGVIKPDVVFFGEDVKYFDEATALAQACDLFFVIGTSAVVYPAAILPAYVPGKIVVINEQTVSLSGCTIEMMVDHDIDGFFHQVANQLRQRE
jgi:NAD-dependent deacetylase